MLRDSRVYVRSRLLYAFGRGARSGQADIEVMDMPDSRLCRATEAAAGERLSPTMLAHSFRTVAYAHAIAGIDNVVVDRELLWCACLLHDLELEHPVAGECFAVRSGEAAERIAIAAGADQQKAQLIGDAICRHASPELDSRTHGLAYLVSQGALVDVVGKRIDEMHPRFLSEVKSAWPRDDFSAALATAWRRQTRAAPDGRAALAERTVLFSLAARLAPN